MQQLIFRNHSKTKQASKKIRFVIAIFSVIVIMIFAITTIFSRSSSHHTIKNIVPTVTFKPVLASYIPKFLELPPYKMTEEWQKITIKDGDNLAKIFQKQQLSQLDLLEILKNKKFHQALSNLKTNQQLSFLIQNHKLQKLKIRFSALKQLLIENHKDKFIFLTSDQKLKTIKIYKKAIVKKSLAATAAKYDIPFRLIAQMEKIFSWEMDFSKDIHENDSFKIIYEAFQLNGKTIKTGKVKAVSYKSHRSYHQALLYKDKSGIENYYNFDGSNLKKAFVRYPVKFSHISSKFSPARKHPILKYKRAHNGVDLAAPMGTPIHATGDGTIVRIRRSHGYGNVIKIRHNKKYLTIYAHMLKFHKGLHQGSKVKKGQIIGYVGQSGLATGPHCHYEFRIHNKPSNPSTVKIPHDDSLKGNKKFMAFVKKIRSKLG